MTKKDKKEYKPYRIGWAKSYNKEVEIMRELILSKPEDLDLLKDEYFELTGVRFRRKKGE